MLDPVTLSLVSGAVGGAGGKAVEKIWDAVGRRKLGIYLDDVPEKARAAGQANTIEFLSRLAVRLSDLEERLGQVPADIINDNLDDPDLLVTFNAALLSSARTADTVKHDVLARAVAERFVAPAESLSALAASLAVEAIPRLSVHHLNLLALLAVIYVIRPPGLPLVSRPSFELTNDEVELLSGYGSWLEGAVDAVVPAVRASDTDYAHLTATACIMFERGLERDLADVLYPCRRFFFLPLEIRKHVEVGVGEVVRKVFELWCTGLQQVTLTPPGILIGVAAYDRIVGGETTIDWNNPNLDESLETKDAPLFDRGRIGLVFLNQLAAEITRCAKNGIEPWSRMYGDH